MKRFFRDRESIRALEASLEAWPAGTPRPSAGAVASAPASAPERFRAWVVGCSTGEEAYSVAWILSEFLARRHSAASLQVFATDIDERAIEVARAGAYAERIAADMSFARRQQLFSREEGSWRIRSGLREKLVFCVHDVMRDPPFSHLQLVCCRNLPAHLDPASRAGLLATFHAALEPGGLLFLGHPESAEAAGARFSAVDKKHGIYRADEMSHSLRPTAERHVGAAPADSNDSLQALNEALQAATDELGLRTQEVQSLNEELITVNRELKAKVEEANGIHDDLNNLMASTDIATLFVDRHLRIKRFTPPALKLFNLIASDIGRPLLDITHRLDYPQLGDDVAEAADTLRVVEREVLGPQAATYLVRSMPYRTQADLTDGAVVTFVDITATRRAEERMRAGERHVRRVIESTSDYAIITCDLRGTVTSWNRGAARMFGYSEAEMMGQPLARIFTERDRALGVPADELRRAREDGRASDERWHQRKDGSTFYCSGIVTPMFEGGLIGYAKIARDLSEAKRTEAQLEASLRKETQIRAELQAASALKDDFLAVMSHELKHPLNLINVNAELLARMPEVREVPAVARAADVIRRTVMSQAKIIDDLLDLSRMQTGKLALEIAPMDWAAVVARVVGAVAEDAREGRLDISVSASPAASRVAADSVRVEQIVWNLVSNALKFTPPGGRVSVELSAEGSQARLDVIDSGQGISADFMPYVFDLFRQADRGTTRAQGGMGIGLALVKNLAEAHGGRVAVASEGVSRGSRFSVWLPLASEPAPGAAERRGARGVAAMRILLVDDTVDALDSFATLLQLEGATVAAASSAKQALALAEQATFDLLVSDVAMPEMDGYELMRRLRGLPGTARLPAIALTGFGRPQDEERARDAGFDAHLTKPVQLETLIEAIARLGA